MQNFGPQYYHEQSLGIQRTGMIALGSWAGLNIISGSYGFFNTGSQHKYFHQMNAAWNVVNLGIAAFGFAGVFGTSLDIPTSEVLHNMARFDRILLINAGLDLLYIGTGALLWKRGITKDSDRLLGYGKSVVVQGGFLLIFDLILYLLHQPLTNEMIRFSNQLSFTGNGIRYTF